MSRYLHAERARSPESHTPNDLFDLLSAALVPFVFCEPQWLCVLASLCLSPISLSMQQCCLRRKVSLALSMKLFVTKLSVCLSLHFGFTHSATTRLPCLPMTFHSFPFEINFDANLLVRAASNSKHDERTQFVVKQIHFNWNTLTSQRLSVRMKAENSTNHLAL